MASGIISRLSDPSYPQEVYTTDRSHIATNYGLMLKPGTTHIRKNDEGYILLHLTDMMIANPRDPSGRLVVDLRVNQMKTAHRMQPYTLHYAFEELIEALEKTYRTFRQGQGESLYDLGNRIEDEVRQSRKLNIHGLDFTRTDLKEEKIREKLMRKVRFY